jgi:hypothetical protein
MPGPGPIGVCWPLSNWIPSGGTRSAPRLCKHKCKLPTTSLVLLEWMTLASVVPTAVWAVTRLGIVGVLPITTDLGRSNLVLSFHPDIIRQPRLDGKTSTRGTKKGAIPSVVGPRTVVGLRTIVELSVRLSGAGRHRRLKRLKT